MSATYALPRGVIHGSDGKLYAPQSVVQALPDGEWTAHWTNGNHLTHNSFAGSGLWYEVRPTAAKTERVPLHELIGRCIEPGEPVTSFTASEGTVNIRVQAFWPGGNAATIHADPDGTVEVLVDGAR